MTSIVELPNEPKYPIKVVASQIGILPVTLRAWERRHNILSPHRASNHYRLYSERDIAILRWLKKRVDDGMPIRSAVSELVSMRNNSIWPEVIPAAPVPGMAPVTSSVSTEEYASQLAHALMTHDETRSGDLLRDIHTQFDLLTIFTSILIPAIEKIDEARYMGEIGISVERFASDYLRGKLLSLFQAYPTRHNAPLILIGCAPMELRELNALMLAVVLRSEGYRVEYLGPDIAIEDLADYAGYEQPAMVILSADSEFTAREMRRLPALLQRVRSTPIFGYIGKAFDEHPELRKELTGIYLGDCLDCTAPIIRNLLKTRQKMSKADAQQTPSSSATRPVFMV